MRLAVRWLFNILPEFTHTDVLLFRIFPYCRSGCADGEWWPVRSMFQIFQVIKASHSLLLQDLNELKCWTSSENRVRPWGASEGPCIARQSCFQCVFLFLVNIDMSITIFILFQKRSKSLKFPMNFIPQKMLVLRKIEVLKYGSFSHHFMTYHSEYGHHALPG